MALPVVLSIVLAVFSFYYFYVATATSNLISDVMFINMEDLMEQPGQLNNKQ